MSINASAEYCDKANGSKAIKAQLMWTTTSAKGLIRYCDECECRIKSQMTDITITCEGFAPILIGRFCEVCFGPVFNDLSKNQQ